MRNGDGTVGKVKGQLEMIPILLRNSRFKVYPLTMLTNRCTLSATNQPYAYVTARPRFAVWQRVFEFVVVGDVGSTAQQLNTMSFDAGLATGATSSDTGKTKPVFSIGVGSMGPIERTGFLVSPTGKD